MPRALTAGRWSGIGPGSVGGGALVMLMVLLAPTGLLGATLRGNVPLEPRDMPAMRMNGYRGTPTTLPSPPPSRAAIYVQVDTPTPPSAPRTHTLLQRNKHFHPPVLPIRVGDRVRFPNGDSVYHSVFSYSPPHPFDLGRYLRDSETPILRFDDTGVVKVYCAIHKWMRATILVLATPHYTLSDTSGAFVLRDLPGGTHTIRAWESDERTWQRSVTLNADETRALTFGPPRK